MTSFGASAVVTLVLLLSKGLEKHVSPRWQYNVDLLAGAVLLLPLLPARVLRLGLPNWLSETTFAANTAMARGTAQTDALGVDGVDFLQDFSVSVTRLMPERFIFAAAVVWTVGAAVFCFALYVCWRRLWLVRESVKLAESGKLGVIFSQAKTALGVRRNVALGFSVLVKSPMTIGALRPIIVLPFELAANFDEDAVRYVLFHELTHVKRRDSLINASLCLLQAVYWWNPLVYFAFRKIREDREISCDFAVLNRLPNGGALGYGRTLIDFARQRARMSPLSLAMEMGGAKRELLRRVKKIAAYRAETRRERLKSAVVFVVAVLLVLCQLPAVSALATMTAREERYISEETNVIYEDFSAHFGGNQGAFVLFDVESGRYTVYNENEAVRRVSPASTYKIYSGLIALEEGVITPSNSRRNWDGTEYSIGAWNRDHDLMSAVQNSVSWYFQVLDRQVGAERLEAWFKEIDYGNHDLSGGIDNYWMASSLKISVMEQVKLLTALYNEETPFKSESAAAMKSVLRLPEKDNAVLCGKTGTITVNGKTTDGWFVGYVENAGHISVFALHIEGENAGGSVAAKTVLAILAEKGIY